MTPAQELLCEVAALWAPPPELTVSQWADQFRYLSPESAAEHGKWRTLPFQREPMDSVSDPRIRRVVIKSATQLMKTVTLENSIGYFADQDPGPMLVLQPGDTDAKDFSKERIAPMIRDTPRLREIFSEAKSRNSDSTITEKLFRGGMLAIAGAGSVRNLQRRAIRCLFIDEPDTYKVTSQGSPIALARKRLATFRHRAKEVITGSPTFENSEIDRAYAQSDQREYYVPCPACGRKQSMMRKFFTNVRWDESLPTREEQARSARYYCEAPECNAAWDDAARWVAVECGEWQAHAPFAGVAGFWISELYSPWKQLWEIVLDFLTKKDSRADYQTFINTSLAENWQEPGEQVEWRVLVDRREDYPAGTVPPGGLFLTAGVDVQREDGGRLEVEIVAWGRNRESWSIDYRVFAGSPSQSEVWSRLEGLVHQTFPTAAGGELGIARMFVDSGDGTTTRDVYEWVSKQPRSGPLQVWAIKGDRRSDQPVGNPRSVEATINGHKTKYGVLLRAVNVDYFKSGFYADLRKRPPTEQELKQGLAYPQGFCHFPRDTAYGDEHFKQLCAEQLIARRDRQGRTKAEWLQTRPRNEGLDCRIYSMAAAWDFGAHRFQQRHWEALEQKLAAPPQNVAPPPPKVSPEAIERRQSWIHPDGRRQRWF